MTELVVAAKINEIAPGQGKTIVTRSLRNDSAFAA
jgi:hypothetical protein